ncbi:MAG TPA: hypothetical protein VED47_01515, partial [Burkholderiaceae bacterium]|nr:hypothetical protein [Burkholderiaceae bacterium]
MKRQFLLAFLLCGSATALASQTALDTEVPGAPAETIRRFVQAEVARAQPDLRAEITVGEIDPHVRLSP